MKSLLFEKQLLCGNFPVHGTTCKSTKVPCDLKKLVTKHDKSWMDRTLEEVEQFRKKILCEIFTNRICAYSHSN